METRFLVLLSQPPVQVHVFDSLNSPRIGWSSLPLKDLVQRLDKLTIQVLSECIRGLPSNGHPTLNSCSRQKTCNSLANHIRARAHFLQSVGSIIVCNILLCYLPLSQPRDQSDEQYIIDILCCEYGRVVVEGLGHGTTSGPERHKVTRREHKIRGSLSTLRRSEWPTPVSKEVVLDCLHRYYEGSKWIDPAWIEDGCYFS
jgi:hypothetical protein